MTNVIKSTRFLCSQDFQFNL